MKAIIMAGGKGTRLRPICDLMPKPMTELLGKPLMEHLTELLKRNGFTDLCVTLGHKPECITRYFENGKAFGVSMQYKIEKKPLGTAGGVCRGGDFAQIAAYGVMTTPALVVDGKVVSYGKVLKKDEAKALIQKVRG